MGCTRAVALVAGLGAAWARADAPRDPWVVRPSFGAALPSLSALRGALGDERDAMQAAGWTGDGLDPADLGWGPSGGVEVLWRPAGQFAYGASFRAARVHATGAYAGTGVAAGQTVRRAIQLEPMGGEAGVTWLAAESEAGSWLGVEVRAGLAALVVSREGATEAGAARWYWWNRDLTGVAPSLALGVTAEWRGPKHPPLFLRVGYRHLNFPKPDGDFADSEGVTAKGTLKALDFSGVELEAGVSFSVWPAKEPEAPAAVAVPDATAAPAPAEPVPALLIPSPSPSASVAP